MAMTHTYTTYGFHMATEMYVAGKRKKYREKNVARKIHTSLVGFNTSEKFNTRKNPVIEYEWIWVVRNSTIDDTALNFFY